MTTLCIVSGEEKQEKKYLFIYHINNPTAVDVLCLMEKKYRKIKQNMKYWKMCAYFSYIFFMLLMHEESNVNLIQQQRINKKKIQNRIMGEERANRACNIRIYYC